MTSKPADASRNLVDSIQHAVGVNVVDVGAWLGPAIAAAWIWISIVTGHTPDQLPSPLAWAGSILEDLGVTASWPASAQAWLSDRPSLFWVALAIATYTAGRELATRSSTSTITWTAIMTAACIKPPLASLILFLVAGLVLAAVAQLLDLGGGGELDVGWYLMRWFSGPGLTVVLVVGAPFFLAAGMIEPYRERSQPAEQPGDELGIELSNMSNESVADTPAREVLAFLARVLLLSTDDQRVAAYRTIKYNIQFFGRRNVLGSPMDRRGWRQPAEWN
ncbi:hypothetical protein RQCS_61920 (plasmid) [Rhodococcus qingshengii]|uniref:hypothetical protein n=1 Tax=Rhodococcus qingshengii TaxID=334542 RepID=UPI0007E54FCC|nr:hypothetical protein [Rhodococcus qingshengii]BCF86647.1 hypothetical protein RQCS_61920 [Rhodococcus qingshengii]